MTLYLGVDLIDNQYRIVGIENDEVVLRNELKHFEFMKFIRLYPKAKWVLGIPHHAVDTEILRCQLNTSQKDCHLILKQQYAYDYHRYQFCIIYMGRQCQQDVWRVARISRDYLQEYLIRYHWISNHLNIIESDIEAIWIWIYAVFKDDRFGALIYQQGTKIYAFVGKNELIVNHVVDSCVERLIEQIRLLSFPLQWIFFFNLPSQVNHGFEVKD